MATNESKPKKQLQPIDYIFEALALLLLISLIIYSTMSYYSLPKTIPVHFNNEGKIDDEGNRIIVFILPLIYAFLYGMFTMISRFTNSFNYPVKITPENKAYQQTLIIRFIRSLKAIIGITILTINWMTISAAKNGALPFGNWFIVIIILPVIAALIIYLSISLKNK
jgi:uncharacterized membrane protein